MKKKDTPRDSYKKLYTITENKKIGKGGNADVFEVIRLSDGIICALKILKNITDNKLKERFKNEIDVVITNADIIDGILPIINHSKTEYWYTMPLAIPLIEHIKESGRDISQIIDGIIELCDTLIKLHKNEFAHRDIKPENIFYHNNRYFLGDFGLVEIPDNPKNLTQNKDRVGARFTMAPEMLRNPDSADGRLADVYSLAKTLWILLTDTQQGFDGQYNFLEKSISLHSFDSLSNAHLVEIDKVLTLATRNSPEDRPSMKAFKEYLVKWKETYNNPKSVQESNWNFINAYLFKDHNPSSVLWSDQNSIIYVLNILSKIPSYNYMMFSDGGGLDFSRAEKANEDKCIYIYASSHCYLVKTKLLSLEIFDNSEWNYFLLELEKQKTIEGKAEESFEIVVEDYPGSYVPGHDARYGVYEYDSGKKLPDGYKIRYRYLGGKFLIVLKGGLYNSIISVTDGRHGDCSRTEFREYMENIKSCVEVSGKDRKQIEWSLNKVYNTNPFKTEDTPLDNTTNEPDIPTVRNNCNDYEKFCFLEIIETLDINRKENIKFNFEFKKDNELSFDTLFQLENLYLCKDGFIRLLSKDDKQIFSIYERNTAKKLRDKLNEKLHELCKFEDDFLKPSFKINLFREGKPKHLFTKQEIKKLMKEADDRVNNTLVIDENGYAQLVQDIDIAKLYPVRYETWCSGNIYVGKYSTLSDIDNAYKYSLLKWLEYLKIGEKSFYEDGVYSSKSSKDIIEEIKKFY